MTTATGWPSSADKALATVKTQVAGAAAAADAAENAAQASEAGTKTIAARFARTEQRKQQAAADAATKRKAADDAKAALDQVQQTEYRNKESEVEAQKGMVQEGVAGHFKNPIKNSDEKKAAAGKR